MFRTEHLEGRLLYETDKVVCINLFVNKNYTRGNDIFLTQILLSLVNSKSAFPECSISLPNSFQLNEENCTQEINEGIKAYLEIRQQLELS